MLYFFESGAKTAQVWLRRKTQSLPLGSEPAGFLPFNELRQKKSWGWGWERGVWGNRGKVSTRVKKRRLTGSKPKPLSVTRGGKVVALERPAFCLFLSILRPFSLAFLSSFLKITNFVLDQGSEWLSFYSAGAGQEGAARDGE